jgi:hypothetical protein
MDTLFTNYAAADGQPAHPPPDLQGGASALFLIPYPSECHPPPFRVKAVLEISFVTSPPHLGHSLTGSSENFLRNSNRSLHELH